MDQKKLIDKKSNISDSIDWISKIIYLFKNGNTY